jgi:shikimate kinase/3-dehydroquinate synthase
MVNGAIQKPTENGLESAVVRALGSRSIVLVGMMGAGKSSIGRRLAARLGIPFIDADTEIESAAGMTISEIFDKHGEPYFRAGEKRVIARLLDNGPQVLATGGGSVLDAQTRALIGEKSVSVWLKADIDVLLKRTKRRNDRPLVEKSGSSAGARAALRAGRHRRAVARRTARHDRRRDHDPVAETPWPWRGEIAMTESLRQAESTTVSVALDARAYDIVIGRGLLPNLGERIKTLRPGARVAIVSDETVARLHLQAAGASLKSSGVDSARIVVPSGEGSKNYATFEEGLRGGHCCARRAQ